MSGRKVSGQIGREQDGTGGGPLASIAPERVPKPTIPNRAVTTTITLPRIAALMGRPLAAAVSTIHNALVDMGRQRPLRPTPDSSSLSVSDNLPDRAGLRR